jgi:hypothetical protein
MIPPVFVFPMKVPPFKKGGKGVKPRANAAFLLMIQLHDLYSVASAVPRFPHESILVPTFHRPITEPGAEYNPDDYPYTGW